MDYGINVGYREISPDRGFCNGRRHWRQWEREVITTSSLMRKG
jgi:hypothetical protein